VNSRNILIIRLSAAGDALHTLPLACAIKRAMPDIHLTWLASRKSLSVVKSHPLIDEIVLFDRQSWFRQLPALTKELNRGRYDIVLDAQSQIRSGLMSIMTHAPERYTFSPGISKEPSFLFANYLVTPEPDEVHNIDRDLCFAKELGIKVNEVEFGLQFSNATENRIISSLKGTGYNPDNEILVGLCPSGSWPGKRWPVENYAELAVRLVDSPPWDNPTRVVILWGPGEYQTAYEIATQASDDRIVIAPSTSFKELGALMKHMKMIVSNDSGPLHLAVAVGTPVIGLYAPTDPRKCGPYGGVIMEKQRIVGKIGTRRLQTVAAHVAVNVNPSDLKCNAQKCRRCHRNDCMQLISVEDVLSAAVIARPHGSRRLQTSRKQSRTIKLGRKYASDT